MQDTTVEPGGTTTVGYRRDPKASAVVVMGTPKFQVPAVPSFKLKGSQGKLAAPLPSAASNLERGTAGTWNFPRVLSLGELTAIRARRLTPTPVTAKSGSVGKTGCAHPS